MDGGDESENARSTILLVCGCGGGVIAIAVPAASVFVWPKKQTTGRALLPALALPFRTGIEVRFCDENSSGGGWLGGAAGAHLGTQLPRGKHPSRQALAFRVEES